jgi:hypothetical protein
MNRFERFAISILMLCAWSLAAWAQGANPPASTKASGQTSGQGQTAVEQTTTKETTLTGCLGGPNDEGAYALTNDRYKKGVEVGGTEGVDLKAHVGHTVKLTGTWVTSGAAIGETKEKTGEKGEQHFKVTKMAHIAATCTPTEKGKSK